MMVGGNWAAGTSAGAFAVTLPAVGRQGSQAGAQLSPPLLFRTKRRGFLRGLAELAVIAVVTGLGLWTALNAPMLILAFPMLLILLRAAARTRVGRAAILANCIRKGVRPEPAMSPNRKGRTEWQQCFVMACLIRDDIERMDAIRRTGKPPAIY